MYEYKHKQMLQNGRGVAGGSSSLNGQRGIANGEQICNILFAILLCKWPPGGGCRVQNPLAITAPPLIQAIIYSHYKGGVQLKRWVMLAGAGHSSR